MKNETTADADRLARAAAHAEGAHEAAARMRDAVLLVLENYGADLGVLRTTLEMTLQTHVEKYEREHLKAIDLYVASIQARAMAREFPHQATRRRGRASP